MNPSLGQIIIISITATAASIGAAGIPHAGKQILLQASEQLGYHTQVKWPQLPASEQLGYHMQVNIHSCQHLGSWDTTCR